MFGIIVAIFAIAQEPWDADPIVQLQYPWTHIEIGTWTYVSETADGNSIILLQPARQRGKVWVRFEYDEPFHGARSSRNLYEINCGEWTTRTLQGSYFTMNNLVGPSDTAGASGWTVAAPETVAEAVLNYGCGD